MLSNITIGEIAIAVAFLVSLISGIAYLRNHLTGWIHAAVKDDFVMLDGKIDKIQNEVTEIKDCRLQDKADNARYRILRFNDEILQGKRHSREHFDQIAQSVTEYERYASDHPKYPNGKATAAIANVKRVYQRCLEKGTFLSEKEDDYGDD